MLYFPGDIIEIRRGAGQIHIRITTDHDDGYYTAQPVKVEPTPSRAGTAFLVTAIGAKLVVSEKELSIRQIEN